MINPALENRTGNRVIKIIAEPAIEPVTVEELKLLARIDGNEEDALLSSFIVSARESIEAITKRAFINRTIRMSMDFWPTVDSIKLPYPPLSSVTSIDVIDEDGNLTNYSSSNYFVITDSIPGQIVLKNGSANPVNVNRTISGYRVTYIAGYGVLASNVPNKIKNAIKFLAGLYYENRNSDCDIPQKILTDISIYCVRGERNIL